MISKSIAIEVINHALMTGADYAEIYQQDEPSHSVLLSYKRVENISSNITAGIGIRLIKDKMQVYGYTSDLSKKSLISLAEQLASSFSGEPKKHITELTTLKRRPINKVQKTIDSVSDEEIIGKLKKAEKVCYDYSPDIVNVSARISFVNQKIMIANSDGVITNDQRFYTSYTISNVAKSPTGELISNGVRNSSLGGYEIIESVDFEKLALECSTLVIEKTKAKDSPSGKMTVVIGNAFGGTLFHEACGHPLEASAIAHNRSTYVGKIGEQIASPILTAIDDGTIDGACGSLGVDDEGVLSTRNVLIKDGILQNYMVDRFNGSLLGLEPTGSLRRQSYRYTPTTRMTNTFIDNGKSSFEEIIASVPYGIYCQSFRGGSVDPSTNNFNFSADTVYMIRDGKIAELVKPVILVGYGYDVLLKIDMIANDLKLAPGMCGASSGSVPVTVGQPTVRISEMVVGGSSKEAI